MTDYDTLRIKIVANAGSALDTVERFSSRLKDLEKTAEKLDFTRIEKLEKILRDIASIDLTKVSGGLYSVAKSFESLVEVGTKKGGFSMAMKELETTTSSSTEKVAEKLEKGKEKFKMSLDEMIRKVEQFNKAQQISLGGSTPLADKFTAGVRSLSEVGRMVESIARPDLKPVIKSFVEFDKEVNTLKADLSGVHAGIEKIEQLGSAMQQAGLNGSQMESVLKTIGQETNKFSPSQIKQVEQMMTKLGFSAEQVKLTISKLGLESDKTTKKMNNGLNKVAIKFKSLALYRVLRLALMKIQQEFANSIQNLAQSDSGFNEAISNLSNSFTYLANSILAMLNPIIQVITPFITMISDMVAELANSLGSLFSSSLGKDTFTQATKGAEDYAESLKKAKNVSLGIDELNVIKKDEGAGLFQSKDIETTNELGSIIKELKEQLEPIMEKVKEFFDAIKPIIQFIFNLVGGFLDQTDETVNESVGAFIDALINVANLLTTILNVLKPVFKIINVIISLVVNILNDGLTVLSDVISYIVDIIKPIVEILEPIIDVIMMIVDVIVSVLGGAIKTIFALINTIVEFVVAVGETLVAVVSLDFGKIGDIWNKFGERFKDIWKGVANFFINVLNALIDAVENFVNFFVNVAGEVASWFGADTSNWGVHIERIQTFATGGFPEDGFFFANHNELVGQFSNGQTAVANNEQITEGIYQAVLSAMRESGGREVVVQVDGKVIGRASEQYRAQKGEEGIFTGGYHYGY